MTTFYLYTVLYFFFLTGGIFFQAGKKRKRHKRAKKAKKNEKGEKAKMAKMAKNGKKRQTLKKRQ